MIIAYLILLLCHAYNLQLPFSTDEEAAASKRMVFYVISAQKNVFTSCLTIKCYPLKIKFDRLVDRTSLLGMHYNLELSSAACLLARDGKNPKKGARH